MKTATRLERLSAAIAAVLATVTIVWGIAGYAYPDASFGVGQLAKKALVHARS